MKCFLIDKTRWTFTFEAPIKSFDFRCTESEKIIECQLLVSCNKLWKQFYPVASHNPAIVFGLYRWGNSRSKTGGSATFKDYSTILTKCTCTYYRPWSLLWLLFEEISILCTKMVFSVSFFHYFPSQVSGNTSKCSN